MECLKHTQHRPYALPQRGHWGRQRWVDLGFFHWRIPAHLIEPHLPAGLALDLFEGEAWLSVVPFKMEDVMFRGLPALPGLSDFPELNLRTYVIKDGKPGVWFFSLDADQRLAVWAARKFFFLPYYKANMQCLGEGSLIHYFSQRQQGDVEFRASYRPVGEAYRAQKGTLEHWLTERYCLYAEDETGRLYRGDIHHQPWNLQPIEFEIESNAIGAEKGFEFLAQPDCAQFSKVLDVAIWPLVKC